MEGPTVNAGKRALKAVLEELATLLGYEYKNVKGLDDEVKSISNELNHMHAFLRQISMEESPSTRLEELEKGWLVNVRELSYDIEDIIDEYKVRVGDESSDQVGCCSMCNDFLMMFAKVKTRRHIAKVIENLKIQVKQEGEKNERYNRNIGTVSNSKSQEVDPRALDIYEHVSKPVGIDGPNQEVIQLLSVPKQQSLKVISIYGLGGLGKTTLARQVYQELKGNFECAVFQTVSQNPDSIRILQNILSEVTSGYNSTESRDIPQLINKISDFLSNKRYLIVVDDLWEERRPECAWIWKIIKCALPNNTLGSRIITTTRNHDVATSCRSSDGDRVYKLRHLSAEDSKTLFFRRLFGSEQSCPPELRDISSLILEKCDGVPLAIVAISGLLSTKDKTETEWKKVLYSIGNVIERDEHIDRMMAILSFSYFHLDPDRKACLLYFSIFPEDFEINKDRLIRRWVSEGFIQAEAGYSLYETGDRCFNELINRSLIQPGFIDRSGEVKTCRVHDIILDFIIHKSMEDNFVTVHDNYSKYSAQANHAMKVRRLTVHYRRLEWHSHNEGDAILPSNQIFSHVRSFTSFDHDDMFIRTYSSSGFRYLRVLDLENCWCSENCLTNIGELFLLRYLGLRGTRTTVLPEEIGNLKFLETLDLRGCWIKQLPNTVVELPRLVHLLINMDEEGNIDEQFFDLPDGIGKMKALEELKHIVLNVVRPASFLKELGGLTKMRVLSISWMNMNYIRADMPEKVDIPSLRSNLKKLLSSVSKLRKLHFLSVVFPIADEYNCKITENDNMLIQYQWFSWCCPESLRRLKIRNCFLSKVPTWVRKLNNLKELMLSVKTITQKWLDSLGDLPVLRRLHLVSWDNSCDSEEEEQEEHQLGVKRKRGFRKEQEHRLGVSREHGFRHLKFLEINAIIPMLTFETGSMPKLEELDVTIDANKTCLEVSGDYCFGLEHLSHLTLVKCNNRDGDLRNVLRINDALRREIDSHPNYAKLELHTDKYGNYGRELVFQTHQRSTATPEREVIQQALDDAVWDSGSSPTSIVSAPRPTSMPSSSQPSKLELRTNDYDRDSGPVLETHQRSTATPEPEVIQQALDNTVSDSARSSEQTRGDGHSGRRSSLLRRRPPARPRQPRSPAPLSPAPSLTSVAKSSSGVEPPGLDLIGAMDNLSLHQIGFDDDSPPNMTFSLGSAPTSTVSRPRRASTPSSSQPSGAQQAQAAFFTTRAGSSSPAVPLPPAEHLPVQPGYQDLNIQELSWPKSWLLLWNAGPSNSKQEKDDQEQQ